MDPPDDTHPLKMELRRAPLRHRPVERLAGAPGIVTPVAPYDDRQLIERIIAAYRLAESTDLGPRDNLWLGPLAEPKRPIHDALLRGDSSEVATILRDPASSALFYGFENTYSPELPRDPTLADFWGHEAPYDALRRLAEAVGVCRVENPENGYYGSVIGDPAPADALLADLEAALGIQIDFPNPFPGEAGLATSRGVATYRAVQGIYQAWRIADLAKGDRVLEIGAGLGRTAYYARRLGVRDYTLVDLPMTGVAQAYFLGRTLDESAIALHGEPPDAPVRILPPAGFLYAGDRYALVVNVDSLTEMSRDTAERYFRAIAGRADRFLSINHEANPFTVRDLYRAAGYAATRVPAWLRRGYVEELIEF